MLFESGMSPRPTCRLQSVRVAGGDGAFALTQVRHEARRFAPHFFTTYAVGVVESGACRLTTPRGSWVASPGSVVVFAPNEAHAAQVISDEPYAYRMAYLSDDCSRALGVRCRTRDDGALNQMVPVLHASTHSPRFRAAHRAVLDDPASASAEGELLSCVRSMFSESTAIAEGTTAHRDRSLVETAKALLTAHIGRRVALEQVADCCGVTPFHLIRVFRRVTGLSPYAYLIVLRVNEARRMLDGGATVSDAVYACCFSDQSHLTRIFKRTLGMPPGLYLRSTGPK